MASGDPVSYADAALAQRRIGTLTGDTDVTAASYSSDTGVENFSCTVVAGRTYRVKYVFNAQAVTTTNTLLVRIRSGNYTGTQITYTNAILATAIQQFVIEADWTAPVSGTQQFSITATRTAGTTNSQFRGAASQPRSLTVEFAYV